MKLKLQFASLFTLGIIATFFFSIILVIGYTLDVISAPFLIIGTIVFNFLVWLVSPYIQTFIYRLVYKIKFYTIDEFDKEDPKLAKFIRNVCKKNKLNKIPRIGIINDDNPTAFTYGSAAFNARIVFTQGLYTYLEEEERNAVVAHEIGHILHRDFIVMTIAATMVQLLYEFYRIFMRMATQKTSGGSKKGNGKAVALVIAVTSLIFYWIASYLLLYLSRVREYYADQFASKQVSHPDHLSMAFVKIAYGIIAQKDTKKSEDLLKSTRALGIADTHTAKNMGLAYINLHKDVHKLDNVMLFDLVSPWAFILELKSTHPLTGKRIRRLSGLAKNYGKTSIFDFEELMKKEVEVDKGKLYGNFFKDVGVSYMPVFLTILVAIFGLFNGFKYFLLVPAALGLGFILRNEYKFTSRQAKPMTVFELMSDIYASPVRGTPAVIEGKVIGRGVAGYRFSEDMMMQDKTGLMYLNYESVVPMFGNLIFAWSKVKKLMATPIKAEGWFVRGLTQRIDLKLLTTDGKEIKSAIKIWSIIGGILLIVLGTWLFFNFGGLL
jgi:Zn-dependent protease with chaperone function